jgi:hypothetical protein
MASELQEFKTFEVAKSESGAREEGACRPRTGGYGTKSGMVLRAAGGELFRVSLRQSRGMARSPPCADKASPCHRRQGQHENPGSGRDFALKRQVYFRANRPPAIPAQIGRHRAVAGPIADSQGYRTRPIAKIWGHGLNAWCDTTRVSARK